MRYAPWTGLGYYCPARNLHQGGKKTLCTNMGRSFQPPLESDEFMLALVDSTAAAIIISLAQGQHQTAY